MADTIVAQAQAHWAQAQVGRILGGGTGGPLYVVLEAHHISLSRRSPCFILGRWHGKRLDTRANREPLQVQSPHLRWFDGALNSSGMDKLSLLCTGTGAEGPSRFRLGRITPDPPPL